MKQYGLSNGVMEALGIAQEEAAEVIQALSKIRRSGPEYHPYGEADSNYTLAQYEVYDFLILIQLAGFQTEVPEEYRKLKLAKLEKYSSYIFEDE